MSGLRSVKLGVFNSTWILFAGKLVQLGLFFVVASKLGASEFGAFAMVLSLAQLLALVATIGGQQGITKMISRYRAKNKIQQLKGLMVFSVLAYLAVISLIYLSFFTFNQHKFYLTDDAFLLSFMIIAITMWVYLRDGITRGLAMIVESQVTQEIVSPLIILLMVLFAPTTSNSFEGFALLWVITFFSVEGILCLYLILRFRDQVRGIKTVFLIKSWAVEMLVDQGVSVSKSLLNRSDVLIVGSLLGTQAAGIYSLASRLAQPATLVARAVSAGAGTFMTAFRATGDVHLVKGTLSLTFLFSVTAISVFVFVSVLFGDQILTIAGEEFAKGYAVLVMLTIAQGIDALAAPHALYLLISRQGLKLITIHGIGLALFLGGITLKLQSDLTGEIVSALVLFALGFVSLAVYLTSLLSQRE